jgi:proteasome lid subunit RPN8/RPN11
MNIRLPKLHHWLNRLDTWWRRSAGAADMLATRLHAPAPVVPAKPALRRLERVVLSEGVAATLFDDYAAHCVSPRGAEEIGWLLMGVRQDSEAVALAALPAGAERDASQVHVRFNADAQTLASRILRQKDRRLQIVGVVHTHPGDMCRPSSADFVGDSAWVANLRQGDAVFGIGTAGGSAGSNGDAPKCGELQFSWYALGAGDSAYRPMPARVDPGFDLAAPLRSIWPTLEANAPALERLCRLFAQVQVERAEDALAVKIALAEPQNGLRVLLKGSEARYYWDRDGELIAVDPRDSHLERAVFLILAELAKKQSSEFRELPALVES